MVDSLRSGAIAFGFWAYRLVALNMLFLVFSLFGLIGFGVLPSSVATYTLLHERTELNPWHLFLRFKEVYFQSFIKCLPLAVVLMFLTGTGAYNLFLMDANLEVLSFAHYSVLLVSLVMIVLAVTGLLTFSMAFVMKFKLRLMDNLKLTLTFMVARFYVPLVIVILFALLSFIYLNAPMLFFAIGIPSYLLVSVLTLEQFLFPVLDKMDLKQQ